MIPNSNLVVVGKKTKEGNVVICSNVQKSEKILKTYRKRWDIERCFKNMKPQGFNLENTHMTSLARLLKLMTVVVTLPDTTVAVPVTVAPLPPALRSPIFGSVEPPALVASAE